MVRCLRILSATLCLLTLPAPAQGRTWNVGPGGSIGATIAQAAHGDLILVAPGNYEAFTLDKGLTILASQAIVQRGQCVVANVPAGRQAAIHGLTIGFFIFDGQLVVRNNRGRVLLDRITVKSSTRDIPGILIESCAQVQLQACVAAGAPTLQANRSSVVATSCQLMSGGAPVFDLPGIPAVIATSSSLLCSRGTISGPGTSAPTLGTEAIVATDSTLTLLGDASTLIQAGYLAANALPVSAVVANRGAVTLDPNVTILSSGTAPPVGGTASVVRMRLPSLAVQSGPPGGRLRLDSFSASGDGVLVLVGRSADRLDLGLLGFWLDPLAFVVAGAGTQGPSEHFTLDIPLPQDQSLRSVAWAMQTINGTFAGGFRLSNPVAFALQ